MPALLTRISTRPSASMVPLTSDCISAELVMSAAWKRAPGSSATAALPRSTSMSETVTRMPWRAKSCAMARPIPEAAPVTMATLPVKLLMTNGAPSCGTCLTSSQRHRRCDRWRGACWNSGRDTGGSGWRAHLLSAGQLHNSQRNGACTAGHDIAAGDADLCRAYPRVLPKLVQRVRLCQFDQRLLDVLLRLAGELVDPETLRLHFDDHPFWSHVHQGSADHIGDYLPVQLILRGKRWIAPRVSQQKIHAHLLRRREIVNDLAALHRDLYRHRLRLIARLVVRAGRRGTVERAIHYALVARHLLLQRALCALRQRLDQRLLRPINIALLDYTIEYGVPATAEGVWIFDTDSCYTTLLSDIKGWNVPLCSGIDSVGRYTW